MSWFDENGFDENAVRGLVGQTVTSDPVISQPPSQAMSPQVPNLPAQTIGNVGHNDTTTGGLNREQWRDKWLSNGQTDMAGLQRFLAENGGTLLSENGTVTTPFGDTLDIGANARTGTITPAWTQVGAASDGPGASGGGIAGGNMGGGMTLGSLGGFAGGNMSAPGSFTPGDFNAERFNYTTPLPTMEKLQTAQPLTAEQLQNDPAYQFRLKQGIGALQNSAAARGSVRDANVWKGLIDYGQEAASQEADKITGRNLAYQGANNAAISGNNATALGANSQGFGQALSGYQANLGALGQNFNNAAQTWNLNNAGALGWGNLALGNKQADNSYSLGQGNLSLGRDQFGLQQQGQYWNQAFNNNAQQWDQYYKLAQLGYPQS